MSIYAVTPQRTYEIWENEQAPNNGGIFWDNAKSMPYDKDWEQWSYPIGNGYMGANLFGRVDTERIQITEKTLYNKGIYDTGGLTNFAELYLDFHQDHVTNYRRSLNLNEAIAYVSYEIDGVKYSREYFMSYPDQVLVIKLSASQKGKVSFTLRPEIPFQEKGAELEKRTGRVEVSGNIVTLPGNLPFFNTNYEAQVKILNKKGTLTPKNQNGQGQITVTNADTVIVLLATGTNYHLREELFNKPNREKLDGKEFPHEAVTAIMESASEKGFAALRSDHLKDYQNLFNRVAINLNSTPSPLPTHILLENYKAGKIDTYLEELMFQHARYLLIASSREKSLPIGLQGVWSQYLYTPWTGGYWHNINVQMNYWGALNANLAESFVAYINYFSAYFPKATENAAEYVKKFNPSCLSSETAENGWIIGTNANAYYISGAGGGHSGPGTGGFTSKLLMDYYNFTQDKSFLNDVGYPALISMSKFFSKALIPAENGLLLVSPSASPEQQIQDQNQITSKPGYTDPGKYYITTGCTFDQGFVWENYNDTLIAAEILDKGDVFLGVIKDEMPRLDPILIGDSGQIKEYREEALYGEIGDELHRHISHLCALYPGTLINSDHKEWMDAAAKTLDFRGNETTGWAMAHRMNCRARLKEGKEGYEVYSKFIGERTVPNLWTLHPPFQIDGNLGTMAAVVEMLLQSHEAYIEPLPALPSAWKHGSYEGLVARGNFVFCVKWENQKALFIDITSRSGGECRIKYPATESSQVTNNKGMSVKPTRAEPNHITFSSTKGETYHIAF